MADTLCGPSNPLQSLQKHSTVDRSLQQDRLTRRSVQQENFRSRPAIPDGALDHELEMFQRGYPVLPPPHFAPIDSRATRLPHANPFASNGVSTAQTAPAWAADFGKMYAGSPMTQRNGIQPKRQPGIQDGAGAPWTRDFQARQNPQYHMTSQTPFQPRVGGFSSPGCQRPMGYGHPIDLPDLSTEDSLKAKGKWVENYQDLDAAAFEREFEDLAIEQDFNHLRQEGLNEVERYSSQEQNLSASTVEGDDAQKFPPLDLMQKAADAIAPELVEESSRLRKLLQEYGEEADRLMEKFPAAREAIMVMRRDMLDEEKQVEHAQNDTVHLVESLGGFEINSAALDTWLAEAKAQRRYQEDCTRRYKHSWQDELSHYQNMYEENESKELQTARAAADLQRAHDQDQSREGERTGDEELAKVAGELLGRVADNDSEKFRNSTFMALMRGIHEKDVRIEGKKFVNTSDQAARPDDLTQQTTQDVESQPAEKSVDAILTQYNSVIPPEQRDDDLARHDDPPVKPTWTRWDPGAYGGHPVDDFD